MLEQTKVKQNFGTHNASKALKQSFTVDISQTEGNFNNFHGRKFNILQVFRFKYIAVVF